MSPHVANRFGVAASTIAVLALVAGGYAMAVPYRLSPPQKALLEVAGIVQIVGSAISLAFGIVALRGDLRSRRFGSAAIALTAVALSMTFFATPAHSVSRW